MLLISLDISATIVLISAKTSRKTAMSHSKHFKTQSAMEKTFKRFTSQQPTAFSSHLTFCFKCDSQEKCETWISLGRPRKVFPSDRSRAGTNSPREIDCRAIRRAPVRQLEP